MIFLSSYLWLVLQQMTLEDGHVTYEQLRKPSIPVYKSFYFFNLTNPVQFQKGTAKAALQEIGPYTYMYAISLR